MQVRLGALDGSAVVGPLLAAAPRAALQQLAALDATSTHRWACCCAVCRSSFGKTTPLLLAVRAQRDGD